MKTIYKYIILFKIRTYLLYKNMFFFFLLFFFFFFSSFFFFFLFLFPEAISNSSRNVNIMDRSNFSHLFICRTRQVKEVKNPFTPDFLVLTLISMAHVLFCGCG
uniref:Uncharacterized protein n=1 Tax=Cacopsylla melanoneura TaxID=428564 RepID=A0A8D8U6N5_9HEMI